MTVNPSIVLIACLASTLFMTGLIWFVQVVHYPLFAEVGPSQFGAYHAVHTRRTTYVVFGPMVVELISSVILAIRPPSGIAPAWAWAGLAAAALTWASTAAVQVPLHNRLSAGFDPSAARTLVRSNLFRSAAWTLHSCILLIMISFVLKVN